MSLHVICPGVILTLTCHRQIDILVAVIIIMIVMYNLYTYLCILCVICIIVGLIYYSSNMYTRHGYEQPGQASHMSVIASVVLNLCVCTCYAYGCMS